MSFGINDFDFDARDSMRSIDEANAIITLVQSHGFYAWLPGAPPSSVIHLYKLEELEDGEFDEFLKTGVVPEKM